MIGQERARQLTLQELTGHGLCGPLLLDVPEEDGHDQQLRTFAQCPACGMCPQP